MTKAKPILFSTELTPLLTPNGPKTQTRRVIKPTKWWPGCYALDRLDEQRHDEGFQEYLAIFAPYQPGDICWVQEAWKCVGTFGAFGYEVEFKDGERVRFEFEDFGRAVTWAKYEHKPGWQSPYFMPREAARKHVRVIAVRAERVQDITPEDAQAEGITWEAGVKWLCVLDTPRTNAYVSLFADLWERLNAPRGHGWDMNDWVWAYTFEGAEALQNEK